MKKRVSGARGRGSGKTRKTITRHPSPVTQVQASSPAVIFQGQDDPEGFRRISSSTSIRDLSPSRHDLMQAVSYYLASANPMGKFLIDTVTNFVAGEGFRVVSEDDAVQEWLDAFWNDPVNDFDDNIAQYTSELGIFGEWCMYAARNPISGEVRLGYIDPANIESVEYGTLEGLPGIAVAMPTTVILRKSLGETSGRRLAIVHREEDPNSPDFGLMVGECFYFSVNRARAATRGQGDLFSCADMIDGYDKMLWSTMQQVDLMSRFIWDVTLTGMTPEQVSEWAKTHGTAPNAGTVRAHNEKVAWAAVSPSLNASDKSEGARMIKNLILGGRMIPEHWFASGSDTTRATAAEQGDPTIKMLTRRQLYVRGRVKRMTEFSIDSGISAGALPPTVNREHTIETPDISVRDQAKAANALGTAITGLTQAKSVNAVDRRTITRFVQIVGQTMGVEIDVDKVLAEAMAEKEADDLVDYTRNPPPPMNADERGSEATA